MRRIILTLCGLFALTACAQSPVADSPYPGYRTNADGELLRDRQGRCWRTADWRPDDAVPACDVALAGPPDDAEPAPKPVTAAAEPAVEWAPVAATLYFGFDDDTLDTAAQAALKQALGSIPGDTREALVVELDGHADHLGNPGYNQALSRRRAEAVRDWLRAQGIPAQAITLRTHGDHHSREAGTPHCPDGDLPACLRGHRRVEVVMELAPGQ